MIEHRRVPATQAAAITSTVEFGDLWSWRGNLAAWYQGAIGEIVATILAQRIATCGPLGGVYAKELFTEERGDATIFLPVSGEVRPVGRVGQISVPGVELAVIIHSGSYADLDRSYGALAIYVSEHALAVDEAIREYYLVGSHDTDDESMWRTEIGWPIFDTASGGA